MATLRKLNVIIMYKFHIFGNGYQIAVRGTIGNHELMFAFLL
jgi:hypothetical protein